MKYGELEVNAFLNRDGSPYSSQEDIVLKVHFRNLAQKDTLFPFMTVHPAKWELKNAATGEVKPLEFVPKTPPGLPRPTGLPEAQISSGQEFTYSLIIQSYLGFLQPGKYSVRYKLNSPKLPFVTDWMDFSIFEKNVDAFSLTQSMPGFARGLHLAWRDRGGSQTRLLLQRSYIGQNKSLMPRVFVVGEGDSASLPVPSFAPEGREPGPIWVGWMAANKLRLARVGGNDSLSLSEFSPPNPGPWTLVPFLNYSESPGGENARLFGSLLRHEKKGVLLSCFHLRNQQDFGWSHTYLIPSGEILAIRLLPASSDLRHFIWVRKIENQIQVELLSWDDTKGLGRPVVLGEIKNASLEFKSFDAMSISGKIQWGIVFRETIGSSKGELSLWRHSFDVQANRTSPGIAKSDRFAAKEGPIGAMLKFDSESRPWILQRDVHGAWVQSPEFEDPIAVDSPRGSKHEALFFRKGTLPRILLFNPETGFETRIVTFPGSEKQTEEDDVEDVE